MSRCLAHYKGTLQGLKKMIALPAFNNGPGEYIKSACVLECSRVYTSTRVYGLRNSQKIILCEI